MAAHHHRGEAFNRLEVGSFYVSPRDRFVVSFIAGMPTNTAEQALAEALRMVRDPTTIIVVHDRLTGETTEWTVEQAGALDI